MLKRGCVKLIFVKNTYNNYFGIKINIKYYDKKHHYLNSPELQQDRYFLSDEGFYYIFVGKNWYEENEYSMKQNIRFLDLDD